MKLKASEKEMGRYRDRGWDIWYMILYTACHAAVPHAAGLQIYSYNDNFIHYIGYCILHAAVPHAAGLQIYSYNDNFIHDIQHIS